MLRTEGTIPSEFLHAEVIKLSHDIPVFTPMTSSRVKTWILKHTGEVKTKEEKYSIAPLLWSKC